jgi:NAD+ synthase
LSAVADSALRELGPEVLAIDAEAESQRISTWFVERLREYRRRGLVIGLSGGVDSSVCAALAVRALGPGRVFGLLMPERDSSSTSRSRAETLAGELGITHLVEDITPALDALGCYRSRDAAIRAVFPEYGPGWKNKIAIAGGREGAFNYFNLVVQPPGGKMRQARLPVREYLQIVAATNFKQRVRKMVEYHHADRLNYAVVGTPNRLEYDQGFFVKGGDGLADVKPIAHLFKTQVYALAAHLGIAEEIRAAAPTTDTYSLHQGQDEFYFALPYDRMDVALWAFERGYPPEALAAYLGTAVESAAHVYRDIAAKRAATRYLHAAPALVEAVAGVTP